MAQDKRCTADERPARVGPVQHLHGNGADRAREFDIDNLTHEIARRIYLRLVGRQRADRHLFGAQHDLTHAAAPARVCRQPPERRFHEAVADMRRQHDRIAQELRDRAGRGPQIEVTRRADLGKASLLHHSDLVGERQRLGLVVGDEDRRDPRLAEEFGDHLAHAGAQPRVEGGEWLVEKHEAGPARHGAGKRHALLLATRQLVRPPGEHRLVEAHRLGQFHGPAFAPGLGAFDAEVDVLRHGQMRKQRSVLRHQADAASMRRHRCRTVRHLRAVEPRGESGASKPAISRSKVVLPQPEGPTIAVLAPGAIESSTPATAATVP